MTSNILTIRDNSAVTHLVINAGNEVEYISPELAEKLPHWKRCNFEQRDDAVYFCEGLHERSAPCEWEKLTAARIGEMLRE